MPRFRSAIVTAILATLLSALPVWAACTQAHLTGTWRLYAFGAEAPDDVPFWAFCTIRVLAGGAIQSGTVCTYDDESTETVTGGQLTVNNGCVVTGTFIGDGVTTIRHATLDRGKRVLMGVAKSDDGGFAMFTGAKK
jgi:hypothetical protein